MSFINKVILLGYVGAAPQVRVFEGGFQIVTFPLAVTEIYKDRRTNSKVQRTEWFKINVWNEHHQDLIQRYVNKGSKLYLEGHLRTRKWTDPSGTEKSSLEVHVKGSKGEIILWPSRQSAEGKPADSYPSLPDFDPDEPVRQLDEPREDEDPFI